MATSALIASAVIGGATAIDSSVKAKKGQRRADAAQDAARKDSAKQAALAEQEMNKMNQKKPDMAALRAGNAMATKPGTLLTSPGGDKNMQLGKSTLLGA